MTLTSKYRVVPEGQELRQLPSETSPQWFTGVLWNIRYDPHHTDYVGEINNKCAREVKPNKSGFKKQFPFRENMPSQRTTTT